MICAHNFFAGFPLCWAGVWSASWLTASLEQMKTAIEQVGQLMAENVSLLDPAMTHFV
jgi:hypothetical protein